MDDYLKKFLAGEECDDIKKLSEAAKSELSKDCSDTFKIRLNNLREQINNALKACTNIQDLNAMCSLLLGRFVIVISTLPEERHPEIIKIATETLEEGLHVMRRIRAYEADK